MTPEQATLAAGILSTNLPSDPERMAAVLTVIDELRSRATGCSWRYVKGTLYAAAPGGVSVTLARVSAFAFYAGHALATPREWVDVTALVEFSTSATANRNTIKSQRKALADRLAQRGLDALAEAVRGIRLKAEGDAVFAIYDPDGVPVRLE